MGVPLSVHRSAISITALVVLNFFVNKVLSMQTAFVKIRNCPGGIVLWIDPLSALSLLLGNIFPRPGMAGHWGARFSMYKKMGATSFASVCISNSRPYFWLAEPEAIKSVSSVRNIFQKDLVGYEIINIYGKNLISIEEADWKRHRFIAMSAFNEENIALVWSETFHVVEKWFEELDVIGPDVTVDLLQSMTQVTLFVIAAAGFGRRLSWTVDSTTELLPDCALTFQSAVVDSMKNIIARALIPEWFYRVSSLIKVPYLSSRALSTQLAFRDLKAYMRELIASARAEIVSGERSGTLEAALLRNLVEANMNQGGNSKELTEDELFSNIFAFLLAGHETCSHTLCFAFVLLALYPSCQQKLYEEITRVWSPDVSVSQITKNHKEYTDKLEYTVACIRETLRTYPVLPRLPRDVHSDTVLPSTSFNSRSFVETGKLSIAVPAGSVVIMDIWAVHMNPLYWGEDAAEFKPERFIDTASYQWPRHAFMPFSLGARSCIGKQFALAEMIGIIASVVRRYRIQVPDELAKRPFDEQRETLLKWTSGITLTPLNARVKFSRRE